MKGISPNTHQWVALAVFVLVCFGAAGLGSMATVSSLGEWYAGLQKPAWTPPPWIFGPVWTALYAGMAVAAWLVWKRLGWPAASGALGVFALQLALNVAWSWLFFGLRRPGVAAIDITLLWVGILATLLAFSRAVPLAGWLMIPYLVWVTFAAALNIAIWRLNG
jgi:tryptophan-rich sensory protein